MQYVQRWPSWWRLQIQMEKLLLQIGGKPGPQPEPRYQSLCRVLLAAAPPPTPQEPTP